MMVCEPFVPPIKYIFFIWVPVCGCIKGMLYNPWPARLRYVALSHILNLYIIIIIISNLSNDRSKASSKMIPPHSAI